MIVVGLTGSIGMGKSTTAGFFTQAGIPVYNADKAVHGLYKQKPVIDKIAAVFPQTIEEGTINPRKLAAAVFNQPAALQKLEAIVHPLVRAAEKAFVQKAREEGRKLVVLDIPLLFETGGQERVDKIVVVTAPSDIQRQRVLSRPDMTEDRFCAILSRQMTDEEKRARADFVIDTGHGMDAARAAVKTVVDKLLLCTGKRKHDNA